MTRAPLLLQVDLDPVATYAAALRGERAVPAEDDPVYALALPRVLDRLAARGLRATLFVVGGWLAGERAREAVRRAVREGHELANHSWSHPLGFSSLPDAELDEEIARAHDAVGELAGVACRGFRAPGWDVSGRLLRRLAARGYAYDASVLPSWTVPLQAAAFLAATARRGRLGRIGRGVWRAALAPARPYVADLERPWKRARSERGLLEIPAGVSPWGVPYSGTVQLALGTAGLARGAARLRGPLAYVFHGVDFLRPDELGADLSGHPAARRRNAEVRIERILDAVSAGRRSARTDEHAAELLAGPGGAA